MAASPASADATLPQLHGWGRTGLRGREHLGEDLVRLTRPDDVDGTPGAPISRGLGRSYGDASLPPADRPDAIGTRFADRILGFDPATGRLHAEAGLSLLAINRLFLPRRFAAPVLPGTQYVTLGGMIAADVHGKNHHVDGCFGQHVDALRLRLADGTIRWCQPDDDRDPDAAALFWATVGGMGLTGHILEAIVRLKPIPSPWIWSESARVPDLDAFLAGLRHAADDWPYTVGWIDLVRRGRGMGRGILIRGRWAEPHEAPAAPPRFGPARLTVPLTAPSWVLNRLSVTLFNLAYFHKHPRRARRSIVHPQSFFHPLDGVRHWNRLYGRAGFTQHQCVLPRAAGDDAVRALLERVTDAGAASFLSVIKDC
ncbi:MAG: FAD-binding oxidoreductase, partial [Acidobacteriota bacterium]